MVVLAKAAPGRIDDLAEWYDRLHIPDLLAVPGFVSADATPFCPSRCPKACCNGISC